MPTTNINIRTDSELKAKAQAVFADLGLDMTTAVNVFLNQVVYHQAIPFEIAKPVPKRPKSESREGPVALPTEKPVSVRPTFKFGCMKGKIWMSDDFDAPLDDMKEYME